MLGGYFTSVGGTTRNRIARLNADGTLDSAFNPNANDNVFSVAIQPDGKILLGGNFTSVGGATRNYIARLNANGTLDSTFNPNLNGYVHSVTLEPNGKILLGGYFTSVGGTTQNRIARLNANGTLDSAFNPNADSEVYSVAIQSDGKILLGSYFTSVGGRNFIARLNADGTLDSAFNPNVNSSVYSMAIQSDGKILLGGYFTSVGGTTRNRIARLNADGTLDSAFNPNADSYVESMAIQSDGKILLGGYFTSVGGTTRNRIARLNADGTLDSAFNPNADDAVRSVALQADGKILLGGDFTSVGGTARNYIARFVNEPATQTLEKPDVTQLRWLRGGTAPEIEQVVFEQLVGSSWSPLGTGTRISGGWEKTGLSLPADGFVRARGISRGGGLNGSGSIIEQVLGFGAVPRLNVQQPLGTNLNRGTTIDFGAVRTNTSQSLIFTITNSGSADLTSLGILIEGTNASAFSVTSNPTVPVTPNGSTTFTLRFIPNSLGLKVASLRLTSNDEEKNPFDIFLRGTGVTNNPAPVPPRVQTISASGGSVSIDFAGTAGYQYEVQHSTNLVDWMAKQIITAPAGGVFNYTEAMPLSPSFYRLRTFLAP